MHTTRWPPTRWDTSEACCSTSLTGTSRMRQSSWIATRIADGNGASAQLLAAVADASLITERANHLRMVFHPLGARRYIVN